MNSIIYIFSQRKVQQIAIKTFYFLNSVFVLRSVAAPRGLLHGPLLGGNDVPRELAFSAFDNTFRRHCDEHPSLNATDSQFGDAERDQT